MYDILIKNGRVLDGSGEVAAENAVFTGKTRGKLLLRRIERQI